VNSSSKAIKDPGHHSKSLRGFIGILPFLRLLSAAKCLTFYDQCRETHLTAYGLCSFFGNSKQKKLIKKVFGVVFQNLFPKLCKNHNSEATR